MITKELLVELYEVEGKTWREVAEYFGLHPVTMLYHAKKFGIKSRPPNNGRKTLDLTNKKFGRLIAIEEIGRKNNKALWRCLCECGNTKDVVSSSLTLGKAKSCGCILRESKKYNDFGVVPGWYWNKIVNGSLDRNIEFSITIEYADSIFNGNCAISGVPIQFGKRRDTTASIDRINNNIGYVVNNIQWVHKRINILKHTMAQEELINWAKTISNFQSLKHEDDL